jgi:hypothetical protein
VRTLIYDKNFDKFGWNCYGADYQLLLSSVISRFWSVVSIKHDNVLWLN